MMLPSDLQAASAFLIAGGAPVVVPVVPAPVGVDERLRVWALECSSRYTNTGDFEGRWLVIGSNVQLHKGESRNVYLPGGMALAVNAALSIQHTASVAGQQVLVTAWYSVELVL